MNDDLRAGGHELWLPIPLDTDPEALVVAVRERFGGDEEAADLAALMAGVSRQLRDANGESDTTGVLSLAAWLLLEQPDTAEMRALATLRVVSVEPDDSAEQVVASLAAGDQLFEEPVSEPMDTRSGQALSVRFRPMVEEAGSSRVHEVAAVLWERPEQSACYVLSTYSTDLVEAREIGDLLEELGAGIEGM